MQPVPSAAAFFSVDQQWQFEVAAWDTPYSSLEDGKATTGMRLRVQEAVTSESWGTYVAALQASSNPESDFLSGLSRPVVYEGAGRTGRWPVVQSYWGSGAPGWWGVSTPGQVAVCFSGVLLPSAMRAWLPGSDTLTFGLAGSGFVRIDVVRGGVTTNLFADDLSEVGFVIDGFSYSATHTFLPDDELFVYYVQSGTEPWGGLVVKALPGALPADDELERATAEAPVLSASLFAADAPLEAAVLPFILSASITQEPGAASRAEVVVPLLNPENNDGHGWVFNRPSLTSDPGQLDVYDGGSLQHSLRRKRLVQIRVARPDTLDEYTPLFTGFVDDFGSGSDGKLTITCVGLEGRMVEQYEQTPDRISYMARGFRLLDLFNAEPGQRAQPVYNVPAFDNWPLAYAVEEMGVRAGVDPSCYRRTEVAVQSNGLGTPVLVRGSTLPRFRAVSTKGLRLKLPRPVHYGNVGFSFTESRPFDDEYIFVVEPTKDLWARTRELTDRLGYLCGFDASGAAFLRPANLPTYIEELTELNATVGTLTEQLDPSAYGATYFTTTDPVTVQATVRASRIDAAFPRNADARAWEISVSKSSGGDPVATGTVNPSVSGDVLEDPRLLFNSPVIAQGSNPTVATLFSGDYDEYVVTLTADTLSGGTKSYIDCLLCYAQDPLRTKLPTLSTDDTALTVTTRAQQDEVRNKVTIVGRKKAAITDSEKFEEAKAPTETEFVVANAVDLQSIVNPLAKNHVGYPKHAVIYDDSIADDGFANYLAQTFIYRQSVPIPGTTVEHPLLPMVEVGDPIAVAETRYDTTNTTATQFVRKVTHTLQPNRFRTTLDTNSWPDYPAYEPRTDIDLSKFGNRPIARMQIGYTSVSGHKVLNPTSQAYIPSKDLPVAAGGDIVEYANVPVTSPGGVPSLVLPGGAPWPPQPGTVQISPTGSPGVAPTSVTLYSAFIDGPAVPKQGMLVGRVELGSDTTLTAAFAELPSGQMFPAGTDKLGLFYYEIVTVPRTGNRAVEVRVGKKFTLEYPVTLGIDWRARVNGSHVVGALSGWLANTPYHEFFTVDYATPQLALPWKQGDGVAARFARPAYPTFNVRYRRMAASAEPYTAAKVPLSNTLPYSPFYDPYASELGEVVTAQMDVLADGLYRLSVRSAVDNTIVAWLTEPTADPAEPERHWQYLTVGAKRQFKWDGVDQLGEWNATQSELYATLVEGTFEPDQRPRIGKGFYAWNQELSGGKLGELAVVWTGLDGSGKPLIGQGTFGEWFVYLEALTDPVDAELRLIDDQDLALPELRVLTHLPEPTKIELKIDDWTSAGGYVPGGTGGWETPAGGSGSKTSLAAYIANDKPVRVRFKVADRPGGLWAGRTSEISVKLNRQVHLKAIIGDQSAQFTGQVYPETTVEQRILVNRLLHNDEHTLSFNDQGYRKAKTFKWTDGDAGVTEWVFRPQDFRAAFEFTGLPQSLEFGDYLQLEEVPGWSETRGIASGRARLNFALMSYLFYLSAYATDRSGRSSWGINRSFVDQAKISNQTTAVTWEDDAMYAHRRTVVCRQWTKEPGWKSGQLAAHGASSGSLLDHLLEHWWWQHEMTTSGLATTIGFAQEPWLTLGLAADQYTIAHLGLADSIMPAQWATNNRVLPAALGTWTWETNPTWVPSISRDLHPYHLVPPMCVPRYLGTKTPSYAALNLTENSEIDLRQFYCFATTESERHDYVGEVDGQEKNEGADIAAAEVWSSPVREPTGSPLRFWPKSKVDASQWPFKLAVGSGALSVTGDTLDYVRQVEWTHYEELRGMYSRNKRPGEAPVKIAPSGPYYINNYVYEEIVTGMARKNPAYPKFHTNVLEWFGLKFRSEYVWESPGLFPSFESGREAYAAAYWWRTRYQGSSVNNSVRYDAGAWVGWKDDITGGSLLSGWAFGHNSSEKFEATLLSPFATGHQPVAVGKALAQTTYLATHLVLVPARRGGS
jgi:hypothetical protein